MHPVSSDFLSALRKSHVAVGKAEVLDGSTVLAELNILGGNVDADRGRSVRRTCQVTLTDPDGTLTPFSITDMLAPRGNELKLYRGVRLPEDVRTYAGEVLRDNPVGYWRLGETSGTTAVDSSGNGNDGTYEGSPTLGEHGALVGDENKAVAFGGNPDHVEIPDVGDTLAGSYECWAYFNNLDNHYTLIARESDGLNYVLLYHVSGNTIATYTQSGGSFTSLSFTPEAGRWYHFVFTVTESGDWKFYVDGSEESTGSFTLGSLDGSQRIFLAQEGGGAYLDGLLDEVAYYENVLSADDVLRHFEVGKAQRDTFTDELVPLGVFGISDVSVDDTPGELTIQVTGFDRARRVQRAKFTDFEVISDGTNYATAIKNLIESRVPSSTSFSFLTTTETTPLIVFEPGDDPWQRAQELAESIGAELFFDLNGNCVLRPEPDPTEQGSVFDYAEGSDCTMLGLNKSLTDERTFNHVIVTGESTALDNPLLGEAKDDDPESPTYVEGPFGDVVFLLQSTTVSTQEQADDAAAAALRRFTGLVENIQFTAVVNPAHEVGDVIVVKRQRAGVSRRHYVIETLQIPLNVDEPMSVTVRERRAS